MEAMMNNMRILSVTHPGRMFLLLFCLLSVPLFGGGPR